VRSRLARRRSMALKASITSPSSSEETWSTCRTVSGPVSVLMARCRRDSGRKISRLVVTNTRTTRAAMTTPTMMASVARLFHRALRTRLSSKATVMPPTTVVPSISRLTSGTSRTRGASVLCRARTCPADVTTRPDGSRTWRASRSGCPPMTATRDRTCASSKAHMGLARTARLVTMKVSRRCSRAAIACPWARDSSTVNRPTDSATSTGTYTASKRSRSERVVRRHVVATHPAIMGYPRDGWSLGSRPGPR